MDDASTLDRLLARLHESGPLGRAALDTLAERRARVCLRSQPTGARWTVFGNIELEPSQLANEAYALSLIVHETRHLRQGFFGALSVRGELEAWQEQFAYLKSLIGQYSYDLHKDVIIEVLTRLSPDSRTDLKAARALMRDYAGPKYRINWLPLYPLGREIWFWLTGGTAGI